MTDRYRFLCTADRHGEVVALIGDEDILGPDGIESLRRAFNAHAKPLMRRGVLTFTASELAERQPVLEARGDMPLSVAAFRRAQDMIQFKQGKQDVAPRGGLSMAEGAH